MTIGPGFAHKAHIEIGCPEPKNIIEAIKPDHENTSRFNVTLTHKKNRLIIDIEAEDVSALMASMNSYLRLVKSIEKL